MDRTAKPYVPLTEQLVSPVSSVVVRRDWSGHRQGEADQQRHLEKVKQVIRDNLPDLISNENVITSPGDKVVRVPIRGLKLPHFRFARPGSQGGEGQGSGKATGRRPGDRPGIDYYEAEVSMDVIRQLMFEDLQLPNLEPKKSKEVEAEDIQFSDVRRKGPLSNIDMRRTFKQNLLRNAAQGAPGFSNLTDDDFRFKAWDPQTLTESNAVVIAMMDVSASMGEFEKYIARACYFWMVSFLRQEYRRVEIVFISHHTEAKEVSEEEFFSRGESGGTMVSSAYQLALDIIDQRYSPEAWNIYPFHFSDGDNWEADNPLSLDLARQLLDKSSLFGYGEIRPHDYPSSLLESLRTLRSNPKYSQFVIKDKNQVHKCLRKFFGPRQGVKK